MNMYTLHKGQVCGGSCLMNALPGHAFTWAGRKKKGGRDGERGVHSQ